MSGLDDDDKGELEGDEDVEGTDEDSSDLDAEEEFTDVESDADGYDPDEADDDLKAVDEALSHKDQNARALAIRRAIEERLEAKRLSQDLDYLDLDLDDED
jgi:hypothetical protein